MTERVVYLIGPDSGGVQTIRKVWPPSSRSLYLIDRTPNWKGEMKRALILPKDVVHRMSILELTDGITKNTNRLAYPHLNWFCFGVMPFRNTIVDYVVGFYKKRAEVFQESIEGERVWGYVKHYGPWLEFDCEPPILDKEDIWDTIGDP